MEATDVGPDQPLGEEGRYHLRRLLGAGGMASVWLAEDHRLGRPVAIKLLAEQLSHDPVYRQRLSREAQVAAGLSHPNLVRVFDFSPGPPRPYLVMEYIPGGTLSDRLRAGQAVEPERLLRELLGALAEVHRAGIVHRDVKPANVLMAPRGGARLTDFGIARPSEATSLTATGLVIGTQRYIAPEVLGGQAADHRSDLFSLGVLLSACLSETSPSALHRLAARLAAADPRQRPASAAAALADLDEATSSTLLRGRGREADEGARRGREVPETLVQPLARASPHDVRTAPGARELVEGLVEQLAGPAERIAAHSPRIRRDGSEIRVHLTRPAALTAAAAIAAAILLVVALASAGGGPTASRPTLSVPPAGAPLSTQLSTLQRDLSRARR